MVIGGRLDFNPLTDSLTAADGRNLLLVDYIYTADSVSVYIQTMCKEKLMFGFYIQTISL